MHSVLDMAEAIVIRNFIGGQFVDCPASLDSYDPSTGLVNARVPDSGEEDVRAAVQAAKDAFGEWSTTTPAFRSKLLHRVADIIESRVDQLAAAETKDQGKPLWLSKQFEIPRAVLNFRHFADAIMADKDTCISEPQSSLLHYETRSPCGVAAVIVPWNLPLYLLTFKLAPAIAYGNTAVVKPSEFTSVTAWMLCSILEEAGVPAGVVNMVFGYGPKAGESLIRHPDVALVSFTGSDRAGTHIASVGAGMAKKVSLEMGGKNAAIVFNDADLQKCIPTLIRGSFQNTGQVCLATSRIYIERSIYAHFVEKFVSETKKIKVGDPFEDGIWMGPLCSKQHYEKVKSCLKIAKDDGANFLTFPDVPDLADANKDGYFIAPVVLTGLSDASRTMQEEIFGPVTCLLPFDGVDEVIKRVNDTNYGLCASVWSRDLQKIHQVSPKLEVGTVWCNCWLVRNLHMPFGGTKRSGPSREGTEDSRDFFTYKRVVCVKYE